ncbi:unnamed protein product [Brachionus calyciflorus]|uniref:G-protein coupled receptors family 1 profile domain-containing protein n=1 Tax=Brachionus calyciflorus TaxID=104777 RepID=A0A814JM39_9BILA|nr:unnamed protein product [Brachionus calyciflorus]
MNSSNCEAKKNSIAFYLLTGKINVLFSFLIACVGFVGNGLGVFVFAQKRFRLHSSSIYLFCLCLSDIFFLFMHLFEETLKTYINVFLYGQANYIDKECLQFKHSSLNDTTVTQRLLMIINITDRYNFPCRFVNYLRYFLRFLSAYIIVAFTIQRTFAIYCPFIQAKFESKRNAWNIVTLIFILGLFINMWVPFLFITITDSNNTYCGVNKEFSRIYFTLNIFYITLTLLIPILVIFVCNTFIIKFIIKASKQRKTMTNFEIKKLNSSNEKKNMENSLNKQKSPKSVLNKITIMLLIMSFSYTGLNLPYLISWCLFFYGMEINNNYDSIDRYYTYSFFKLCELANLLNYGIHFYIYCSSGYKFRMQLRQSFKTG